MFYALKKSICLVFKIGAFMNSVIRYLKPVAKICSKHRLEVCVVIEIIANKIIDVQELDSLHAALASSIITMSQKYKKNKNKNDNFIDDIIVLHREIYNLIEYFYPNKIQKFHILKNDYISIIKHINLKKIHTNSCSAFSDRFTQFTN